MTTDKLNTIDSIQGTLENSDYEYSYQNHVTPFLDEYSGSFDENIINKIVLWKVSRSPFIPKDTLIKINKIHKNSDKIDENLTKDILKDLLDKSISKGFGLPMASTVLRFKAPKIYQIIDQRVFRVITGEMYKEPYNIDEKIKVYLNYLSLLKSICKTYDLDYQLSDRTLYSLDIRINKDIKLNGYGK